MTTGDLAIVVSEADEASVHIGECLHAVADWETTEDEARPAADGGGTVYRRPGIEFRTFEGLHLETEGIADVFDDPAVVVFASKHAGETGPLLTAHHTGNFGTAEYGGEDRSLARAAPSVHSRVLAALAEHAPEDYGVGMECTHHGPTDVGAPSLFVEVGSGPEEWADPAAAQAVARVIFDLVEDGTAVSPDAPRENGVRRHLVGFGGGHYAPRFERVVRETDWVVGHVAADWSLEELGDPTTATAVLEAAFHESAAAFALLEDDRPALASAIESLGSRVVSETWVRETDGVPLGLVETLEAEIASVDDGLRFGRVARDDGESPSEPTIGTIPNELLAAVNGEDPEAALAAVDRIAVGYDTDDNGSRLADTVAFAHAADEDSLLEAFVAVLANGYDEVERGDDAIVARRREFDPELAREAGVSPGPDFGTLAAGESVTVDGNEVTPDEVAVERTRQLSATICRD